MDFQGQSQKIRRKLIEYVYPQLRSSPRVGKNIKKLKNFTPETWRYRIGDYRFFYNVDDKEKIVFMLAAETRGKAY